MNGIELRVKGKVQGVGFRPFVWQLAHRLGLFGQILNDGQGVLIRLVVDDLSTQDSSLRTNKVEEFKRSLLSQLPPLAEIEFLHCDGYNWKKQPEDFAIVESQATSIDTQIVPDAATCPECLAELLLTHTDNSGFNDAYHQNQDENSESFTDQGSKQNHRYHYPFINCTHCGPRFTIIKNLPYDRPKTVMADFPMCNKCEAEYKDPADRRYHAQPIACPECGPTVHAVSSDGTQLKGNWFKLAITALRQGKIIAIKSVGGFHLACDATNPKAVARLRDNKHRRFKPFAVMANDIATAKDLASISDKERLALQSCAAPIVLLEKRAPSPDGQPDNKIKLAENIAPNLNEIGIMLPSNPLQHLISAHFSQPVVMTSGNGTGLPPALDNQSALTQLCHIADLFILHNRDIVQRCDDSLVRINNDGQQETLRRSRGLVPDAITLPAGFPDADGYIAYGGDLKNAFAVGKKNQVIVSQYLGDLANIETQQQYQKSIAHFQSVYELTSQHHIADRHPGYFSHQYAQSQQGSKHFVQHHHAHIASCLVENGWQPDQGKVLALTLDGLGLGENGTFWGAELLLADYNEYTQLGGIPAVNLVGGDKAAKEPWRAYYAHLKSFVSEFKQEELEQRFPTKPINMLNRAMESGLSTHSVRSAGRFFDAVAASLDIAFDGVEYEGQAACQLEAFASRYENKPEIKPLEIEVNDLELDMTSFWTSFLAYKGSTEEKAYLFHLTLAAALAKISLIAKQQNPSVTHLVFTGGVFHNALLTKLLKSALHGEFDILQHKMFSCGDGNLALGQMAIALMKSKQT